jgi:AcrR family transcriptional regulator
MATPRTARSARERVREEMTAEILAVARAHLAEEGAAALSLRSVARDLELAPSALYRYFDGRDALVSALIMAAYEALAAEAERAADQALRHEASDTERWRAVPRAMRKWALGRPHEWGLIFGTPVPGYEAPPDTVEPYARVASAMVRPVIEAKEAGRLTMDRPQREVSDVLREAVSPVTEALFSDMPVEKVVLVLQAWTAVIGVISLEVFGHWRNTILDPDAFFEATMRDVAEDIGLN